MTTSFETIKILYDKYLLVNFKKKAPSFQKRLFDLTSSAMSFYRLTPHALRHLIHVSHSPAPSRRHHLGFFLFRDIGNHHFRGQH